MTTRLRPLTRDDLDAVARLEPVLFGSQAWSRQVYREELRRADRRYIAAEIGGTFVGYAGVALEPEWNVMTVGVDPDARRRGVATVLVTALVEAARGAGGSELFLEVKASDGGAQQLYRNAGFVRVGLRRRYYQPEGEDAVVMRLDLETSPAAAADEDGTTASAPERTDVTMVTSLGGSGAGAPFVDVDRAHELVWSSTPPVVLDVRYSLSEPDGRRAYVRGHVPGAVYVDLNRQLAAPSSPEEGRHPLPDLASLQEAVRSWGISAGSTVLIYDDWNGFAAARAWWLLRWAGLSDVAIIDGGLRAWVDAGHHLEDGDVRPRPGDATLAGGGLPVLDIDAVADWAAGSVLLDARAGERFRGEVEPLDPRAGHVPGAVSAPTAGNLTEAGWLLEEQELRDRFAALGVTAQGPAVAAYCGSGVTAAHTVAVLAQLGIGAALYPGSWSQWSSDPSREVATGA